jgi:MFS family permease
MQNALSIIAILTLFAFTSAGLVALPPAIIASLSKNSNECGARIGMAFAVCALGALAGNPIAGALLTAMPLLPKGEILKPGPLPSQLRNSGRYNRSWSFAGITLFVAGLLVVLTKYLEGRTAKRQKLYEAEISNA